MPGVRTPRRRRRRRHFSPDSVKHLTTPPPRHGYHLAVKQIRYALALVTAILAASPGTAETLIEARSWPAELSGRLDLESLRENEFFAGVDPIDDLGLEEDGIYELRLVFRTGKRTVVRLAWQPLVFAGDEMITGRIGELEITPRVQTDLDLDYGRVAFAWQFLSSRDGRFRLGPMIEAKGFQGEAAFSVDNPIVPLVRTTEFETGLPSAGLMLDLEPSRKVHVFAEASVLVDTDEGELTDGEAGIRYFVTPAFAVTAGYRSIEIDIEDGTDVIEIEIDSLFVGATFRF